MANNKNEVEIEGDFDFGFEFGDDMTEDVMTKEQELAKAQNKAEAMYKMIMPLLKNLKKNPDKPNIVWPDREKKIDEFIKKLDSVLNS